MLFRSHADEIRRNVRASRVLLAANLAVLGLTGSVLAGPLGGSAPAIAALVFMAVGYGTSRMISATIGFVAGARPPGTATVQAQSRLAGIALFCVGTASAFGWLLAYYQIPKAILAGVSAWQMGHTATGFFIAFVFLVVGCFLDAIPAIIIVGSILQPLAKAVAMDPVHFAMIGIVSLAFGLVTPPYGLCLMIACAIAGIRMIDALKDTFIMLMPMLGVLALMIVWPQVALFLPSLISPEFLR